MAKPPKELNTGTPKPSAALIAVIGDGPFARTEVVKNLWNYIRPKARRTPRTSAPTSPMFELVAGVGKHLVCAIGRADTNAAACIQLLSARPVAVRIEFSVCCLARKAWAQNFLAMHSNYAHIRYQPDSAARRDYLLRRSVGAFFSRFPPARWMLRNLESVVTAARNCVTNYEPLLARPGKSGARVLAQAYGSGFGYDDERKELDSLLFYREQLRSPDFESLPSESAALYKATIAAFERLFASDPSIRRVLDFGVSYAHVEHVLAQRHPTIDFIGCDRSRVTMMINQADFGHVANMHWYAGDIYDCMQQYHGYDVLFHMRTASLLPMDFVEQLYVRARQHGARHVVMAEQIGISWETGEPYTFSDEAQDSVLMRWKVLIHNYPNLLARAGFKVGHAELVSTGHNDKNLRILVMIASLPQG